MIGPHRDDLDIVLDGQPAGAFASRGQARSIALALKLAEAAVVTESAGRKPILALDDVLSEFGRHPEETGPRRGVRLRSGPADNGRLRTHRRQVPGERKIVSQCATAPFHDMQLEHMNDQAGIGQTSELVESIDRAAEMIVDSDYAVAMTGAGMSVESGIPPFRGAGGLWTRYGTPPMDAYSRFKADPQGYWHREMNREIDAHILELRNALAAAKPHEGHRALARMVSDGALKTVITQNIDGLDERAGITDLIEIHGNRSRLRCTTCGARKRLGGFVLEARPRRAAPAEARSSTTR